MVRNVLWCCLIAGVVFQSYGLLWAEAGQPIAEKNAIHSQKAPVQYVDGKPAAEKINTWINTIDNQMKETLPTASLQQRIFLYGFFSAMILLGPIFILLGYIYGNRYNKKVDSMVQKQERTIALIEEMKRISAEHNEAIQASLMRMKTSEPPVKSKADEYQALDQIVQKGSYQERVMAAVKLFDLDSKHALESMKRMMTDVDPFQREALVRVLGAYYHPETLPLLLDSVSDNKEQVSVAAVESLHKIQTTPGLILSDDDRRKISTALEKKASQQQEKS
jgi:HEAT repeats